MYSRLNNTLKGTNGSLRAQTYFRLEFPRRKLGKLEPEIRLRSQAILMAVILELLKPLKVREFPQRYGSSPKTEWWNWNFLIDLVIFPFYRMVAQNFQVLEKLGFCSNCSQNFSGCSFARARIFLQVLACSVFDKGSFLQSARCSQGWVLSMLVLAKKSAVLACSIPLSLVFTTVLCITVAHQAFT